MNAGQLAAELGFEPKLLNQLRVLSLRNRGLLPGPGAGRRRAPRAGSSAELMDYRTYVPGDDLRRLDWNVLARLDTLFVRVFRAEENLLARLYLDVSRSMAYGDPAKFHLARQLVGALSYIGLISQDRVETAAVGGAALQYLPATAGEVGAARVWRFLAGLTAEGRGDLHRQVSEAAGRRREPGLTLLVSDGLVAGGLTPTLKSLLAAGHEVVLLHVLHPDELDPKLEGDWRLVDMESAQRHVEVTLSPVTVTHYRNRIDQYVDELRQFCRRHGAGYFLVLSNQGIEEAILGLLRGSLTT